MKSIFFNDYDLVKRKLLKYLIFHFIILILFLLINFLISTVFDNPMFAIMGINYNKNSTYMETTFYFYNLMLSVFLMLNLFFNEHKNGLCNIYLRMTSVNWWKYKNFSIIFLLFIYKAISYIITYVVSSNYISIDKNYFLYFVLDFEYSLLISYLVILLICAVKNKYLNTIFVFASIIILYLFKFSIVGNINKISIFLILNIILYYFLRFIIKKNIYTIFEKNG